MDIAARLRDLDAQSCTTRAAVLAAFWTDHAPGPVVEPAPGDPGSRLVTFLWRDLDAEAVVLTVDTPGEPHHPESTPMTQVPSTDVWHLSMRLPADHRLAYRVRPIEGWAEDTGLQLG